MVEKQTKTERLYQKNEGCGPLLLQGVNQPCVDILEKK